MFRFSHGRTRSGLGIRSFAVRSFYHKNERTHDRIPNPEQYRPSPVRLLYLDLLSRIETQSVTLPARLMPGCDRVM